MSFCQKPGCAGPVGEALQVERAIGQVREHHRCDAREVGDQLALGHGCLVHAVTRREQDLVEVREPQVLARDVPRALGPEAGERVQLRVGDEPGGVGVGRRRAPMTGTASSRARPPSAARRRSRRHRARPSPGRRPARGRPRAGPGRARGPCRRSGARARPGSSRRSPPGSPAPAGPSARRRGRRPSGPCSPAAAPGRTAGASVSRASRRARRSLRVRPSNPEPTLPANRSRSPSYTPTTRAPSSFAVPSPGVQPPTTSSCSGRALILSQVEARLPGS